MSEISFVNLGVGRFRMSFMVSSTIVINNWWFLTCLMSTPMTVLMVPNDIAIFFMAQRFKEIFEATPSNAVKITLGGHG